jgi:NAD(P)-dependent dehydrogenase (short-subunit alcohol dehydrogenase family)
VVVNDISERRAAETVDAIRALGGEAISAVCDITTDAPDLVAVAVEAFGRLDILVNNAGITGFAPFTGMPRGEWWRIFDTHIRGTLETTWAAWPHLIESGSGRLINISSSGMLGAPGASPYSAAKAAIWGLGNTLIEEGKAVGIQVTTLHPSAWTPMTDSAFQDERIRAAMRERLPAEGVAAFVTWLAHEDTAVFGDTFQVSGNSAGRGVFSVYPRVQVPQWTPEAWAEAADSLTRPEGVLSPLRSASESFRAELVLADPALDEVLPHDAAEVI